MHAFVPRNSLVPSSYMLQMTCLLPRKQSVTFEVVWTLQAEKLAHSKQTHLNGTALVKLKAKLIHEPCNASNSVRLY